jgi:hypothetical protein
MRRLAYSLARGWLLHRGSFLLIVIALLLSGTTLVLAQTGGGYDLSWWTVDGGGSTAVDGGYALMSTAGQPDAGAALIGRGYRLVGGFWASGAAAEPGADYSVYLPLVMRNFP